MLSADTKQRSQLCTPEPLLASVNTILIYTKHAVSVTAPSVANRLVLQGKNIRKNVHACSIATCSHI